MTLEQQMNAWENWSKTVNTNITSNAGKITLIENDFLTIVNDVKAVDSKTQTNAQKTKAISDDMEIVKADLGRFGAMNVGIEANRNDVSSLKDFVGINNYSSLDSAIATLGYKKENLTQSQIYDMGFLDTQKMHHYSFDNAKFNWWKGNKSLKEFATELGVTLTDHNTRIHNGEEWRRLFERDLPLTEMRLANIESGLGTMGGDIGILDGRLVGLENYTGAKDYTTLNDYITALGFSKIKTIIDTDVIDGWGFRRETDFPTTDFGKAWSGIKNLQGEYLSFSDVFSNLDLNLLGLQGGMMGFAQCFRGGKDKNSAFKSLIESMETQYTDMAARFDNLVSEFSEYPNSLQDLINRAGEHLKLGGVSAGTKAKAGLAELKAMIMGGKSSLSEYGVGVPTVYGSKTYEGFGSIFAKISADIKSLKTKVSGLKKCCVDNLNW